MDEKVDRVAIAIALAAAFHGHADSWDGLSDYGKDEYRGMARAAMDAMA